MSPPEHRLSVPSLRPGVVDPGGIPDTSAEQVLLPVALHLDYEHRPVPARAPEVEPHVLVAEGEPRQLRGGVADVIHLPVRREHHVQQVEQHILVPLVPEDGLEPRIGEDVDITPGGGVRPVSLQFSSFPYLWLFRPRYRYIPLQTIPCRQAFLF